MLTGCRILVIEEEILVALDIQRMLETAGAADAVLARSPAEAMALKPDWPAFDIAMMDARMGADNAVALATELDAAGVGVIVASADGGIAALFPRATLLAKPFGEDALLAACHSALASTGPSLR